MTRPAGPGPADPGAGGLRAEVVAELLTVDYRRPLTARERQLWAMASPAERLAVARYHASEARRLLEEVGVLKVTTALDLTPGEAQRAYRRAVALWTARLELGGRWAEGQPLSHALKVCDANLAAQVRERLVAAGFSELAEPGWAMPGEDPRPGGGEG